MEERLQQVSALPKEYCDLIEEYTKRLRYDTERNRKLKPWQAWLNSSTPEVNTFVSSNSSLGSGTACSGQVADVVYCTSE